MARSWGSGKSLSCSDLVSASLRRVSAEWVPRPNAATKGKSAMKKPKPRHSKPKPQVKRGKVLVVASGKGGVGKTTSTAALGAALARTGQSVVVVDFDVGLRNLDLVMGAERRVVFDLISVIKVPDRAVLDLG